MKTLYLDCQMGAAGDMLTAALLELLPEEAQEKFIEDFNALGIPGIELTREKLFKCGIGGTHMVVKVNGEEEMEALHHHSGQSPHNEEHSHGAAHGHHHSGLHEIEQIVYRLPISEAVKSHVLSVYHLIAKAESHVHGVPITEIHFHEVGTLDAVADVTACSLLIERIAPEQIIASPVHVGSGHVRCAHGILPVPAPATAYILRDVPIYGGSIDGELCTPTGAALLKHFVTNFGDMPVMKTENIGYGMGKKDFPKANCVRALLGKTEDQSDTVAELFCNIDDMSAEAIGFAMDACFKAGAVEVYTVPVGMKKSRPGVLLCVMCCERDKEKMVSVIFKHTTTLGIREKISKRYILDRTVEVVKTKWGPVKKKVSAGYGTVKEKYEYDDIAYLAEQNSLSLNEVINAIENN